MKAKYKIGMFISFTTNGTGGTGVVEGVITRKTGYLYEISTFTDPVSENDITAAFREVKARAVKTSKARAFNGKVTPKKATATKELSQ